jgi:hypothetical protein
MGPVTESPPGCRTAKSVSDVVCGACGAQVWHGVKQTAEMISIAEDTFRHVRSSEGANAYGGCAALTFR